MQLKLFSYVQRMISPKITKPKAVDLHERWRAFLRSYSYNKAKCHFHHACCNPKGRNVQSQILVLHYWQQALTMACYISTLLEDEISLIDKRRCGELDQLRSDIWETLTFLIRGTHLIKQGHPLIEMTNAAGSDFLLHAATDALSTCTFNQHYDFIAIGADGSFSATRTALSVFYQVLDRHPEQLVQVGPVLGRLPLHIAAANFPTFLNETKRSSSGTVASRSSTCSSEDSPNCSLEILEAIVSKCPTSAAAVKDHNGLFPLQIAASSGYPWTAGMSSLFQMAPGVVDCSLSLALLMRAAEKASLTTLFLLLQSAPQLLFNNGEVTRSVVE